jgi:hypothetical protein
MSVLILCDEPCEALERILAYIEKADKIPVQKKRASQWLPTDKDPKRIIIHVEVPCRLAIPYGGFNVLAVSGPSPKEWAWAQQDMDFVVHNRDIETSLPHLQVGDSLRESIEVWRQVIHAAKRKKITKKVKEVVTPSEEGQKVSIVTLTRGLSWWPNMVQNILSQTWPLKDIEWLVVDDKKDLVTQVAQLQRDQPDLTVRYLEANASIGMKRNAGVAAATHPLILFMDDDDHYPATSVEKRVKALIDSDRSCIYCATLPIYDIQHYVSSLLGPNVKKLPHMRASEASLAFRKDFWRSNPFLDTNEGEGQDFIKGRETETAEISPNGILVAFLHKGNPKARFGSDTPPKGEPNGCHYGFSEKYFTYLHQVGMSGI